MQHCKCIFFLFALLSQTPYVTTDFLLYFPLNYIWFYISMHADDDTLYTGFL